MEQPVAPVALSSLLTVDTFCEKVKSVFTLKWYCNIGYGITNFKIVFHTPLTRSSHGFIATQISFIKRHSFSPSVRSFRIVSYYTLNMCANPNETNFPRVFLSPAVTWIWAEATEPGLMYHSVLTDIIYLFFFKTKIFILKDRLERIAFNEAARFSLVSIWKNNNWIFVHTHSLMFGAVMDTTFVPSTASWDFGTYWKPLRCYGH